MAPRPRLSKPTLIALWYLIHGGYELMAFVQEHGSTGHLARPGMPSIPLHGQTVAKLVKDGYVRLPRGAQRRYVVSKEGKAVFDLYPKFAIS